MLDVGAELGTEDAFNEDEGATNGGLLLEPPIGADDPGIVEADGTGAELIESTVNKISNRMMADIRTSRLPKEYESTLSKLQQSLRRGWGMITL